MGKKIFIILSWNFFSSIQSNIFFSISLQVKVEIVVQFFKVGEIDTLKEQYNADVIVKAKWREPSFDGKNAMVRFVF